MKRFFLLFLTAVLCFSLLVVPVFADEVDPIFVSSSAYSFRLTSKLPGPGYYDLILSEYSPLDFDINDVVFMTSKPVYLTFDRDFAYKEHPISYISSSDSLSSIESYWLIAASNGELELCFYADGRAFTLDKQYFFYISPTSLSVADVVEQDVISNVFSEVLSILPAVLGVLVAFIAIRKGVSFTFSFVSEA